MTTGCRWIVGAPPEPAREVEKESDAPQNRGSTDFSDGLFRFAQTGPASEAQSLGRLESCAGRFQLNLASADLPFTVWLSMAERARVGP